MAAHEPFLPNHPYPSAVAHIAVRRQGFVVRRFMPATSSTALSCLLQEFLVNRSILLATMAAFLCLHSATAQALTDELPADVVTGLMPLTAYGIAYLKDDDEGKSQFLWSTGVSLVLNTALRVGFNQTSWGERPNGSPYGFPSGHAGFVTSSAAFLQDRYGWKYGLPAYLVVGYVSWVRVDTGHHRWRDVIAGTAVSYGVSKYFVSRQGTGPLSHLAPVIGSDLVGLSWQSSF